MSTEEEGNPTDQEEKELLSKIIAQGVSWLKKALDLGLAPEMFYGGENRQCLKHMLNQFYTVETKGTIPTRNRIKQAFPTLELPNASNQDIMEGHIAVLREHHVKMRLFSMMADAAKHNQIRPFEALRLLHQGVLELNTDTQRKKDIFLAKSASELKQEYYDAKDGKSIGVPWPWKPFTEKTAGMQKQDFTIIFGRTKNMKTWVALNVAAYAYQVDQSARILIESCELPPPTIRRRLAALTAGVNYELLKMGKLKPKEEREYFHTLDNLEKREEKMARDNYMPGIMICDNSEGGGGVSHLATRIEAFRPDWVIVDSWYKMANDRTGRKSMRWDDQAALSQDIKQLTKQFNIPIIGVTQKKRSGGNADTKKMIEEDLEDMSYSDAAGQEADLILRVKKMGVTSKEEVLLEIKVAGAREINVNGIVIAFRPAYPSIMVAWIGDNGEYIGIDGGEEKVAEVLRKQDEAKESMKRLRKAKKDDPERQAQIEDPTTEQFREDDDA